MNDVWAVCWRIPALQGEDVKRGQGWVIDSPTGFVCSANPTLVPARLTKDQATSLATSCREQYQLRTEIVIHPTAREGFEEARTELQLALLETNDLVRSTHRDSVGDLQGPVERLRTKLTEFLEKLS